jgi:hypothetical protein
MIKLRKLHIPVFTNLGFIYEDLHDFVNKITKALPSEVSENEEILSILKNMHQAFRKFDMKGFIKLYHIMLDAVTQEMMWAVKEGKSDYNDFQNWLLVVANLEEVGNDRCQREESLSTHRLRHGPAAN